MQNSNTDHNSARPMALGEKIRRNIEKTFLACVRLYTFNTPIAKGKFRAHMVATSLCRYLPESVAAPTRDGRLLSANLTTGMETTLYFHGEYETTITEKVAMLLREGDTCLDVGANFGWYTTLLRKICGSSGAVHAFEPVPSIYQSLCRNYEMMGSPDNVYLNHLALGDSPRTITINLFEGLSTGHASLSTQGRDDAISFECEMITLDSYLESKNVGQVNFVKVDIEGSELMFLKGAEKLFEQEVPPMWLMEMALQQTRNFGYKPNELLQFLSQRADYEFYAIEELTGKLKRITEFAPDDIGANVFCIPAGKFSDRTDAFFKSGSL